MSTTLELLNEELLNRAIQQTLHLTRDEPDEDIDYTVMLNELAYEMVSTQVDGEPDAEATFISMIEGYLDRDGSGLSDYDAAALVEEHYNPNGGGMSSALKSAASTCLMHRTLDDLETLGLHG